MNYSDTDYRTLAVAIWSRAIADYSTLTLPSKQKNKELREAFESAAIFIWLDDFYLENFFDENNEQIHIEDFLKIVADRKRIDKTLMRKYAADEVKRNWKDQNMIKDKLPNVVIIDGEPYWVVTAPKEDITKERQIIIDNRNNTDRNWRKLALEAMKILNKKHCLDLSQKQLHLIAASNYYFFKLNEVNSSEEEKE